MTHKELKDALTLFGFDEHDLLTLKQIRQRHRQLIKESHPDVNDDADPLRIRQLNAAATVIMDYVHGYRFTFTAQEFYRQIPEERLRQQFSWDPIWAGKQEQQ